MPQASWQKYRLREQDRKLLFHGFPALLTRWQPLAVAGDRTAEDSTVTGLTVVVVGGAGHGTRAVAVAPLVPRAASTVAVPLAGDVTLCDRHKGTQK